MNQETALPFPGSEAFDPLQVAVFLSVIHIHSRVYLVSTGLATKDGSEETEL